MSAAPSDIAQPEFRFTVVVVPERSEAHADGAQRSTEPVLLRPVPAAVSSGYADEEPTWEDAEWQ